MTPSKILRVMHVTAPARFGGLEQVVEQLASGRASRGAPTAVLALLGPDEPAPLLAGAVRAAGVDVIEVRTPPRAYLLARAEAVRGAAQWGAQVLHTHGYLPDVLLGSFRHRVKVALVSTAHGFTGGGLKNRVFEWLQVRTWRRFDRVIAVSRPLAARLRARGIPERILSELPSAWSGRRPRFDRVEARVILGLPATGPVLGWAGRLSHEKGPDVILRALAMMPEPRPVLAMLGTGRLGPELENLAAGLGIADRVRWLGAVPGAADLFPAFDLLVLSSRTEGTPMVVLEAMAAMVPVVATRVGGVPDMIDGGAGVLVPADHPPALARALVATLADPEAAQLARTAFERLETRFSPARWLAAQERIYELAVAAALVRR